jgi:predicted aspartyl protease
MPTATTGYFAKSGSPAVKAKFLGISEEFSREFEAIIDTGFTGFQAFPLGSILFGTTTVILVDGSRGFRITAWGQVQIGEEKRSGLFILEPKSSEVLIGVELPKAFGSTLVFSPNQSAVLLIGESATIPQSLPVEPPNTKLVRSEARPQSPNDPQSLVRAWCPSVVRVGFHCPDAG